MPRRCPSHASAALNVAAARLASLVEMHDTAVQDEKTLDEARRLHVWRAARLLSNALPQSFKRFQGLLEGVNSLADVDARVDALIAANKLDPALLLTASKMYMSVKESPYTSEEVKDIMAHLYWRARSPATCYCSRHL
jgi:protein-disulfide isomerase-like protein with CxxC motif